jgi:hypothetical protein
MRNSASNGGPGAPGNPEGIDEVRELRQRIHLLTEENHSLFEQVTLLRAHFDSFN